MLRGSPLTLDRGVWIALGGTAAIVAGGTLSRARATPWQEPAAVYGHVPWEEEPSVPPRSWATSASVPPPGD